MMEEQYSDICVAGDDSQSEVSSVPASVGRHEESSDPQLCGAPRPRAQAGTEPGPQPLPGQTGPSPPGPPQSG